MSKLERYLKRKILYEDRELSKYPMHLLKRVNKPTNLITESVQRVDPKESAAGRAGRADFGEKIQGRMWRLGRAEPMTSAMVDIVAQLALH